MPKLKNVSVISTIMKLPMQSYDNVITFYNLNKDIKLVVDVFNNDEFDVFGYFPEGFFYSHPDNIKDILERMNKGLDVAFSNNKSIKDERPFFINKRTTKSKVNTFDDIVGIANNEALFREVLDTVLVYE
jgi:hypothetical protein|tara:strand:- start:685 stop:1074 length:390 start_codon:yes stop_codon:yes gene_type:complete